MRVLILSLISALFAATVLAAPDKGASKKEKVKVEKRVKNVSADWTDHNTHDPGARGKDRAFQNIVHMYATNPQSQGLQKAWGNWVENNYQEGMDIDAVIAEIQQKGSKKRAELIAAYEAQSKAPDASTAPPAPDSETAAPASEPAPAPRVEPPTEAVGEPVVVQMGDDELSGGSGDDVLAGDQEEVKIKIIEGTFVPAPTPAPETKVVTEVTETVKADAPVASSGSTTLAKTATDSATKTSGAISGTTFKEASGQMEQQAMQSQIEATKTSMQSQQISNEQYMQLLQAEQQEQQQMLEMMNAIQKAMHDTAMSTIRNIKG